MFQKRYRPARRQASFFTCNLCITANDRQLFSTTLSEESGVLHNLLQDLEAFDSSKRTLLALDVWITDLKTKEEAFLAAAAERTEADAARQWAS